MQAMHRIVVLVLLLLPLQATLTAAAAVASPTAHGTQASTPCHQAEPAGPDTVRTGDIGGTSGGMDCPMAHACGQHCATPALLPAPYTTSARALDWPNADAAGMRSVAFPPPHRPPLPL